MRPGHTDLQVDDFHNPTPLYHLQEGGVDGILKGLLDQSARRIDRYVLHFGLLWQLVVVRHQ